MPLLFLAATCLAGCKPSLGATGISGRTITVTNRSNTAVRVERIVANGQDGREECTAPVGVTLGPNHSHTVTFFNCGRVERIAVEGDAGTINLDV